MSRSTRIAQRETRTLIAQEIEVYDPATGTYSAIDTPDSVTFLVENQSTGEVTSLEGQAGAGGYYAEFDFDTAHKYIWQCEIEKDGRTGIKVTERIDAEVSITHPATS